MTGKIKVTSMLYSIFFIAISISLLSFTTLDIPLLYDLKYALLYTFIGLLVYVNIHSFKKISLAKLLMLVFLSVIMILSLFNAVGTGTSIILVLNSLILLFSALFLFPNVSEIYFINLVKIMFVIVLFIVSIPSLILSFDDSNFYLIGDRYRFIGYFNNANELARFSALGFLLALRLFPLTKGFLKRIILFAIMGASIYLIYLTDSRAALLLCLVPAILSVGYWLYKKVGTRLFIVISLFISILFLVILTNLSSVFSNISANDLSSGRIDIWTKLIESRSPLEALFGTGRDTLSGTVVLTNGYLEIMMYFGLFGLAMWGLLLLTFLFKKIKSSMTLYGSIIIVGFLIYYVFEGGLISLGNIAGIYFWLELTQREVD